VGAARRPGRDLPRPAARCGGLSSSVLTDRLAELREAGIVTPDSYQLTAAGRSLRQALHQLDHWATNWQPPDS
jgi:DNA-binding HxlR family transcriptional regulator